MKHKEDFMPKENAEILELKSKNAEYVMSLARALNDLDMALHERDQHILLLYKISKCEQYEEYPGDTFYHDGKKLAEEYLSKVNPALLKEIINES